MNNVELWAQRIADAALSCITVHSPVFAAWYDSLKHWEQADFRDKLAKEIEREL